MGTLINAFEQYQIPQRVAEPARVRAILVDGSPEYPAVAMALLDFHEVVDLVGRAASTEEAIELAVDLRPDLILVDLDMQFAEFLIAFIALSPDLSDLKVVGVAKGHELTARAAELVVSVSALISKANLREEFPRILKVLFNVEAARHRQPSLSPQ